MPVVASGDVSVKTARSARSKNRYKKARKWDRVNLTCGGNKLAAFSLGKRISWFPFAFSLCGVQGKLKV